MTEITDSERLEFLIKISSHLTIYPDFEDRNIAKVTYLLSFKNMGMGPNNTSNLRYLDREVIDKAILAEREKK